MDDNTFNVIKSAYDTIVDTTKKLTPSDNHARNDLTYVMGQLSTLLTMFAVYDHEPPKKKGFISKIID